MVCSLDSISSKTYIVIFVISSRNDSSVVSLHVDVHFMPADLMVFEIMTLRFIFFNYLCNVLSMSLTVGMSHDKCQPHLGQFTNKLQMDRFPSNSLLDCIDGT